MYQSGYEQGQLEALRYRTRGIIVTHHHSLSGTHVAVWHHAQNPFVVRSQSFIRS